MKVLELFAGTRSIGKAFEANGHSVFSVEWNKDFDDIDLYGDISKISADTIIDRFGHPDIVWASPDCTTFSIAAISHHRKRNPNSESLDPVSEYAKFCDACDIHVLELINALKPKFYFIENPRGGASQDVVYAKSKEIHDLLLSVRRYTNETYGHFYKSSKSGFQTNVQERIEVSHSGTERVKDRNSRSCRLTRAIYHTG